MHSLTQRIAPFSYQKISSGLIKSAPNITQPSNIVPKGSGNVNKIRIIHFLYFLGIFAATYQIGSMSTVSEEEANAFMAEFEELVLDIDAFGIFTT